MAEGPGAKQFFKGPKQVKRKHLKIFLCRYTNSSMVSAPSQAAGSVKQMAQGLTIRVRPQATRMRMTHCTMEESMGIMVSPSPYSAERYTCRRYSKNSVADMACR